MDAARRNRTSARLRGPRRDLSRPGALRERPSDRHEPARGRRLSSAHACDTRYKPPSAQTRVKPHKALLDEWPIGPADAHAHAPHPGPRRQLAAGRRHRHHRGVVARDRLSDAASTEGLLLLALAVFSAVLLNSLLIRYRLEPMDRLVRTMDQVDLHAPGMRAKPPRWAAREVQKLNAGFNYMLVRHRGGAPPGRPRRAARPGARALADRPGPPRRGQPGADRHPAAARGDHDGRAVRAAPRAAGDQAARQPGDGGAAPPRPPAAPDRARRPRPDPRARVAGRGLLAAHRHRRTLLAPRRAADC